MKKLLHYCIGIAYIIPVFFILWGLNLSPVLASEIPCVWGAEDNGLRLGISFSNYKSGHLTNEIIVSVKNISTNDMMLNLGSMLANGRFQYPTAINLRLKDRNGAEMTFSNKGYFSVSGRVDSLIVPLPAGADYSLSLKIDEFVTANFIRLADKLHGGDQYLSAKIEISPDENKRNSNDYFCWAGRMESGQVKLN